MAPDVALAARRAGMEEHRFRSMGCDVTLLAPPDHPDAGRLVRGIFESWDVRFSRFRSDSELEALNNSQGHRVAVSELMVRVIGAATRAAHATDGLFDPLLGGRMTELGYDRTFDELPSTRSEPALSDWQGGAWRAIVVDPIGRTVRLPVGYRLDLGGIAKGMAVDAALAALVVACVPYAAVSAGGDLAVIGMPPDEDAWSIAIEGPWQTAVAVRRGALATSSVLRRRWEVNGAQRHHLLDPRTGMPAAGPIVQATVAAATCEQAEVAAKMAILSDLPGAIRWLEHHRLAALLLTADGDAWRVGTWE
jgi:thiamine biosynthesis lipoprotein